MIDAPNAKMDFTYDIYVRGLNYTITFVSEDANGIPSMTTVRLSMEDKMETGIEVIESTKILNSIPV